MSNLKLNVRFAITDSASYFPGLPISNSDILNAQAKHLGIARKSPELVDKGVERLFGHSKRYWVHKPWEPLRSDIPTSEDLAYKSCSGFRAPEVFVHGSTTTSRYTGSQAAALAGRLAWQVPAFETKAGCSTSLCALQHAWMYLKSGYKSAVVSCSETLSKVLSPREPESWLGLSDGAGVIRVESHPKGSFEVLSSYFCNFGEYVDLFTTRGTLPPTSMETEQNLFTMSGNAEKMKDVSWDHYLKMINTFLPSQEIRNQIRWIIPHQVNRQLALKVKQELNISGELWWVADRIGNCGGAAILTALCAALEEDLFRSSGLLLLLSVGGGLSCAAQLIKVHQ